MFDINPGQCLILAGLAMLSGILFVWMILIPFALDAAEWVLNIGGRRR